MSGHGHSRKSNPSISGILTSNKIIPAGAAIADSSARFGQLAGRAWYPAQHKIYASNRKLSTSSSTIFLCRYQQIPIADSSPGYHTFAGNNQTTMTNF
jgi:hypothetical protein